MGSAKARAKAWLAAYERFRREGRKDLARRALQALAAEPGYRELAQKKLQEMGYGKAGGPGKKIPAAPSPAPATEEKSQNK
jgi:hypothetical protein